MLALLVRMSTEMIGNRIGDRVWFAAGMVREETASELLCFGGGDGTRTHEPLDCQSSALPAELHPQFACY